jgi:hypothetical protein
MAAICGLTSHCPGAAIMLAAAAALARIDKSVKKYGSSQHCGKWQHRRSWRGQGRDMKLLILVHLDDDANSSCTWLGVPILFPKAASLTVVTMSTRCLLVNACSILEKIQCQQGILFF